MKIKRFFATDMRQGLRMVKEKQGPDAVILSTRKLDDGVELITAIDFDEASISRAIDDSPENEKSLPAQERNHSYSATEGGNHIGRDPSYATERKAFQEIRQELAHVRQLIEDQISCFAFGKIFAASPFRALLLSRLNRLGFSFSLVNRILKDVKITDNFEESWLSASQELKRHIQVTHDDILTEGGIVAMVGPTGVGKTTTVAKFAARFVLSHGPGSVALVTTDNYRIAAHEQLNIYGKILGVPVRVAADGEALQLVLEELKHKQLVIIDTTGMSQHDIRLSRQIRSLAEGSINVRKYLIISANSQTSVMEEVIESFGYPDLGCILTKLDETKNLGEALSVVITNQLPIAYVTDGQRVPEDIYPAGVDDLLNRSISAYHARTGDFPEQASGFMWDWEAANAVA
ncbi:MAG: flagellar biosynthesis protein FlhF [Thermodesulfobacteriota bacterium]|nr:flagellar biosynthesis protein FlhF [Thermodesulfobacteriota bacterium]